MTFLHDIEVPVIDSKATEQYCSIMFAGIFILGLIIPLISHYTSILLYFYTHPSYFVK